MIEKAFLFALQAHGGQKRKDGKPYIVHPVEVAMELARNGADEALICAGFLHDVIEDAHATSEQIAVGLAFGGFAVLSTEYGVQLNEGVILNVRDAGPLCAGLLFGAPAGLIAGTIDGLHRWLCVYWGGGTITRVACSMATFLAGVFSGIMRHTLFDGKTPGIPSAFGIGTTMEVLHMLLVLATNLNDVSHAFHFVQLCSFPMILCNGIALSLSTLIHREPEKGKRTATKSRNISQDFGFWLFVCVVIAFFITGSFTQQIIYRITTDDAKLYRNVTLYLVAFMEILIYTALFILIYQMLKKKITCNLERVNEGLRSITAGNLDTTIDVRTYKEFSELSDDVNATVSTLKRYIKEAEERIDQELEFARQISRLQPFHGQPLHARTLTCMHRCTLQRRLEGISTTST